MRLVIIANPVSGGGRAYRAIKDYLRHCSWPDWQIEMLATRSAGHAGALAAELMANPPDLLGICGGDGTLNEVASSVPRPQCPVAVLPAGTANVVARELGIPLNPVRALQIGIRRSVRHVDLGKLVTGTRHFIFVAGIGFDAFVVARVRPELKKRFGMAAYAAAIIDCLRKYPFPAIRVSAGGETYDATSCLACNARSYGGGLLFCPEAVMTDGLLDLIILEGSQRLRLAAFLLKSRLGIMEKGDWIHRLRARTVRIEGDSGALVQVDGELAGTIPAELGLVDRSFPLVVA